MSSQVILSGLVLAVHTRVLEREERKESLDGHGTPEPEHFLNHGPVSASSHVVHTVMSVEPILPMSVEPMSVVPLASRDTLS